MDKYNDDFIKILPNYKTVTKITNKEKIKYINIESSFDIETTSTILNGEKFAFMYEWTFGIDNFITYGRTWDEFINLLSKIQEKYNLNEQKILVVYVHNLSYEFQFMRKYIEWLNVFAVDDRKPIKALCEYGIEFRDSYILSGYSLSKTAENLSTHKIEKLIGDLDYDLVRHFNTTLTEKELNYCYNDVKIILYYINEQISIYGDVSKIPLTNTGRVRKFVGDKCLHANSNHRKDYSGSVQRFKELMKECKLDTDQYIMLKQAFQGGFTHSAINHTNEILYNVHSIDFTSSYPFVMLSEKFPLSRPIETKVKTIDEILSDEYGYLLEITFTNIQSANTYESYISESKCSSIENSMVNNGRVFRADTLTTTITNIDLEIITKVYNFSDYHIHKAYKFYMQYLPKQIINAILDLYVKKTTLKNVEGKEVEYLLSKGMLNSVYGMSVTDIIRNDIIYKDEWHIEKPNIDDFNEKIEKYNNSKKRFLYYPWGVWVTAYARRNLWQGIINIGEDYVYSDTDSIKFLNYDDHKKFIDEYNKNCEIKLKKMCDFRKIDFARCKPKTIKGIEKLIGLFDYEGMYTIFKTLGAKRYMYSIDDKLYITIAGLSKQNGANYLLRKFKTIDNVFKNFNDDLYIPSNETGKKTHTYIDNEMGGYITDYTGNTQYINSLSSIHLSDCEFTLSISKQYAKFINDFLNGYVYKGVKYE